MEAWVPRSVGKIVGSPGQFFFPKAYRVFQTFKAGMQARILKLIIKIQNEHTNISINTIP